MNQNQKLEFAKLRLEAYLNKYSKKYVQEYADNMYVISTEDGDYVDDGAHGYLIVKPSNPNYMTALIQLQNTSYNYNLVDGTILLEEDCEAEKFINSTKALVSA